MHSALPVRKLIYEIARNLDKSVGQTVFLLRKVYHEKNRIQNKFSAFKSFAKTLRFTGGFYVYYTKSTVHMQRYA